MSKLILNKDWLPIYILAIAVVLMNTSEFLPVGLLTEISADFSRTESTTGGMITIYAWVVSIASIPMALLTAQFNRRLLILFICLLFVVVQLLSASATSYPILVFSRTGLALLHAVFWAIVPPLVYQLAPPGKKEQALGLIAIGTGLSLTFGVPLGNFIGQYFSWRNAFVLIAVIAVILLILLFVTLPSSPSKNRSLLQSFQPILKLPVLVSYYIILGLVITGDFTAYTYIEPFLKKVVHLSDSFIVIALLISGLGSIAAGIIYPYCKRYEQYLGIISLMMILFCALILEKISGYKIGLLVNLLLWGTALTILGLELQNKMIGLAGIHSDLAIAISSGVYNFGIGLGAWVGGIGQDRFNLSSIGYIGSIFILMAIMYHVIFWIMTRKQVRT